MNKWNEILQRIVNVIEKIFKTKMLTIYVFFAIGGNPVKIWQLTLTDVTNFSFCPQKNKLFSRFRLDARLYPEIGSFWGHCCTHKGFFLLSHFYRLPSLPLSDICFFFLKVRASMRVIFFRNWIYAYVVSVKLFNVAYSCDIYEI